MNMEGLSGWETEPGQWYRYNGKERDTLSGWYEYGARWYDAGIGRFTGVDPIADQFPWVSVFNYAENRPIDGVDLWGMQYVNFNKSFYSISRGQTWEKTNSFQGGVDAYGISYSGTSIPISMVQISINNTKLPLYSGSFARSLQWKAGLLGSNYDGTPKTKSYEPDRRYYSTQAYDKTSGKMVIPSKVGLAFIMTDLAMTAYNTVKGNRDLNAAQAQRGFIDDAWKDVLKAVKAGMVDTKFYNLYDLSSIANFVYQGVDNFGSNEALRATAIDISKNVSGNYKGDGIILRPDSGLDNYRPAPILVYPPKNKQD